MSRLRIFHLYREVTIASEASRATKFKSMLIAQGLWAGRDLNYTTPTVIQGLNFSCLIWRTAPFSCLLQCTWRCVGSILTLVLKGQNIMRKLFDAKQEHYHKLLLVIIYFRLFAYSCLSTQWYSNRGRKDPLWPLHHADGGNYLKHSFQCIFTFSLNFLYHKF
jgi:hypothetical protein